MLLNINDNKGLIIALQTDKEVAFDFVYRAYFPRLCAFCSQYLNEQEDIEEVVQETMLWLWENTSTLMVDLSLKTLLFVIVKNKALNRISHYEIKRKVYQEIAEKYKTKFESPDFYMTDELFKAYEQAVKNLPKEFREVYLLTRSKKITRKEIASRLNVSSQTVNYRVGQALKLLRMALKKFLPSLLAVVLWGL
ncbi:RNA polymerase sigma-70 factor (ECF subfamily) [Bacteroides zoogleoformans]|uniref:RNA polymerase sigma-70 factor n=1 Tax=Bacteroides zoogleoformans TaxID=28119 RepID=A0ABM6T5H6_9BACE|nr:RNA polymerase sigma-70 factor [Bacteroides zoogleoformans]AVM51961.1 RNA polymerase sigma-70 factor [Bacteroides zoogleoformans]TWJ13438.1 RNA polymerase sigma-70 factor (ECF subfamily) [Bacteroides zoogleoformans]